MRSTCVDATLDDHIKLDWSERIKIFEEGLDKKNYELHNHKAWRATFMGNAIQILASDLLRRVEDPNDGVTQETKHARE